jgi:hypothetical protein
MVQVIPVISAEVSKSGRYSDGATGCVIKTKAIQILPFERLEELSRVYDKFRKNDNEIVFEE